MRQAIHMCIRQIYLSVCVHGWMDGWMDARNMYILWCTYVTYIYM